MADTAGTDPGAPDGAPEGPDGFDGLVLDEDFVRAADAAEPSARARMLAARRRREDPGPQPWRSDEPPAGWFFSRPRRRARRRWTGLRRGHGGGAS
ncbi:hypothetical protein [Streptomyces sp. NPDC008150]|uniref:SGM_3592 family protein n=1 Tax=Streptomyces sp. NPDC008150 TaxID=3364816 RepID=UPI0036ED1159